MFASPVPTTLKPSLVRSLPTWLAIPWVPDPFRTWTLTFDGETESRVGLDDFLDAFFLLFFDPPFEVVILSSC